VTDRSPHAFLLPLLGHVGLVLAIVADFYRRSSEGGLSVLLSAVCLAALVVGGVLFVRHPRSFFFASDSDVRQARQPSPILRLLAWALVLGAPVLWLIAIDKLSGVIASGLGMRLVGAYVFFAWIAAAIIVSPYLFGRRR